MKKNTLLLGALFLGLILVSSCAPEAICADEIATQKAYGFFGGLLHGLLLPVAVIAKMFSIETGLYALNNTGFLYWLGYLIGFSCLGGGAYKSRRRK